jgi:uncharacterized protein (TIGR02466 family)
MKRAQDWLFPTPVMVIDFDEEEFNGSECVKTLFSNIDEKKFETESTITTDDGLFRVLSFQPLVELIDREVKIYAEEMHMIDSSTIKMTAMWSNIHKGRSSHLLHMHANSFISGVFYLYTPEVFNSLQGKLNGHEGKISFEDPRDVRHVTYPDYINQYAWECARTWDYEPKVNKLILFPGYLKHQVYDFDSGNDYRISVSFNYMLTSSKNSTTSFNLN